jgi:hypothetical protein
MILKVVPMHMEHDRGAFKENRVGRTRWGSLLGLGASTGFPEVSILTV